MCLKKGVLKKLLKVVLKNAVEGFCSVVLNHIKSSKHKDGKLKLTYVIKAREPKAFEDHDAETHIKDETARVPESLHDQICACIHGSSDFCPLKELCEENRFDFSVQAYDWIGSIHPTRGV